MKEDSPHTTNNEIEFINGLGKHSEHKYNRKKLLDNYLFACSKRKDWGSIKRAKVVAHILKGM